MKKPLQVKVLEWWFGLLAGVASLLPLLLVSGALQDGKVDLETLPPAVGLCVGILFFWGLFVAARRFCMENMRGERACLAQALGSLLNRRIF